MNYASKYTKEQLDDFITSLETHGNSEIDVVVLAEQAINLLDDVEKLTERCKWLETWKGLQEAERLEKEIIKLNEVIENLLAHQKEERDAN